jgi:hypothetical protein
MLHDSGVAEYQPIRPSDKSLIPRERHERGKAAISFERAQMFGHRTGDSVVRTCDSVCRVSVPKRFASTILFHPGEAL